MLLIDCFCCVLWFWMGSDRPNATWWLETRQGAEWKGRPIFALASIYCCHIFYTLLFVCHLYIVVCFYLYVNVCHHIFFYVRLEKSIHISLYFLLHFMIKCSSNGLVFALAFHEKPFIFCRRLIWRTGWLSGIMPAARSFALGSVTASGWVTGSPLYQCLFWTSKRSHSL